MYTQPDSWALENFSNAYRNWLQEEMDAEDYGILFDVLHDIEYEWYLPRDEDRGTDGIFLRSRFEYESGLDAPEGWDDWPCSFLEFLVALAFTIEDSIMYDPESETGPSTWFWCMMENIGLERFTDEEMLERGYKDLADISSKVDRVLKRKYKPDGHGGLFPLEEYERWGDQRCLEYWYQANAWAFEYAGLSD